MENKERLLRNNEDHCIVFTMMTEEVSRLNILQQNYLKQFKQRVGLNAKSCSSVSQGSKMTVSDH